MTRSNLIGYARVSTTEQNTDLQRRALTDAGVRPEDIYEDQVSGAVSAAFRPGLAQALAACSTGDTLIVWRIDRLGRSLIDVLNTAENLTVRGVGLRSISDNIDSSTPTGRMLL